MATILDYLASTIVFGILALTVARLQQNINSTLYKNTFSVNTQTDAVQLARQIEYDFLKMGFHVPGQQIMLADTTSIVFKGDLANDNTVRNITYSTGTTLQALQTTNPRDYPLYRNIDGNPLLLTGALVAPLAGTVKQNWGLISFKIIYYDSNLVKLATPILTTNQLAKIRAIDVAFRLESPEAVVTAYDTTWVSISWEKLMFPRNLNQLYL